MKPPIQMKVRVRDLVQGFIEDDETNSVTAWDGKLIVRPEYQRQFVYNDKETAAVINTVLNQYPLGIMYFAKLEEGSGDAEYEVMDGQQRIISICRYAQEKSAMSVKLPTAKGGFNAVNFANLAKERKEALLDYELMVYVCEGTEAEKLEWFEVINIAGKKLEDQELRSAIYHGPWVTDAKSAFVRPNCAAQKGWKQYMDGDQKRQKWLETVMKWAADAEGFKDKKDDDAISQYMRTHRFDENADALWDYFEHVMNWATGVFTVYRKEMKKVDWGFLYNKFGKNYYDASDMEKRVAELMADDEIEGAGKSGIYAYLLDGEEKHLNLRQFSDTEKRVMYERQKGICPGCSEHFEIGKMHGDHIVPWSEGGKTRVEDIDDPTKLNNTQNGNNGQMLCTGCNLKKSNK